MKKVHVINNYQYMNLILANDSKVIEENDK